MVETSDQGDPQKTINRSGKYLTFTLGNEEYGIGITKVKEIIGIMDITEIPDQPDYAKGIINLRDRVIPVIDLRLKFHMAAKQYDSRTCIIVVEIAGSISTNQVGVVVDSVSEVLAVTEQETEPPPSFGEQTSADNILGMAKVNDTVKILLDIDRVLTVDELDSLH